MSTLDILPLVAMGEYAQSLTAVPQKCLDPERCGKPIVPTFPDFFEVLS